MADVSVRVVTNRAAARKILTSVAAEADVTRRARLIATAADARTGRPGDHIVDSQIGRRRARAAVITDTWNARWREARDRALTSSIDAGRA